MKKIILIEPEIEIEETKEERITNNHIRNIIEKKFLEIAKKKLKDENK